MSYQIVSTEKTVPIASTHETKAMLYLMNFYINRDEMFYFVIDFFNDVTGIDRYGEKAWDVQSKATKGQNAKFLGQNSITLYKNHLAELKFTDYILFVGGVSENALIDKEKKIFNLSNLTEKARTSFFKGVKEEAIKKSYINNEEINDENIKDFMSKVTIIIDDKTKADYIKKGSG